MKEVREAMQKMKKGKSAGPSGVAVEVIEQRGLDVTIARIATNMIRSVF